jgi:hypothetical protein
MVKLTISNGLPTPKTAFQRPSNGLPTVGSNSLTTPSNDLASNPPHPPSVGRPLFRGLRPLAATTAFREEESQGTSGASPRQIAKLYRILSARQRLRFGSAKLPIPAVIAALSPAFPQKTSGLLIRLSPIITNNYKQLRNHVAAMLRSRGAHAISEGMETETIPQVDGRLRKHRSALTNGNRLFVLEGNADGRSASYRRFKDVLEQILADLGGSDILSEGQRQLCRRAATLSIMAESMECDAVGNKPFDVDLYGQLTDRLGRCLQRLGLERKPKDVTPTLQSYLQAKAAP